MRDALSELQSRWEGRWRIWRARRDGDHGDERTGDFVATRVVAAAGPDPTVMHPTLAALDAALTAQAVRAAGGERQLDVAAKWLR